MQCWEQGRGNGWTAKKREERERERRGEERSLFDRQVIR